MAGPRSILNDPETFVVLEQPPTEKLSSTTRSGMVGSLSFPVLLTTLVAIQLLFLLDVRGGTVRHKPRQVPRQ